MERQKLHDGLGWLAVTFILSLHQVVACESGEKRIVQWPRHAGAVSWLRARGRIFCYGVVSRGLSATPQVRARRWKSELQLQLQLLVQVQVQVQVQGTARHPN